MIYYATFIVLAVLGVVDSIYLIYNHRNKETLICPLEHDCSNVTESRWGNILGLRNEVFGLIFYSVLLLGVIMAVVLPDWLLFAGASIKIITVLGVLYSLFLTYIQFFIIKDWCFYCLISATLSILLLINSFAIF